MSENNIVRAAMGYLLVLCLVSNQYTLETPLQMPLPMWYASVYVKSSTLHSFPWRDLENNVMCYVVPHGPLLPKETEKWLKSTPDLEPLRHGRIYAYLR